MAKQTMFGLLESLTEAEIDFVLVGGLAVALHGYQRLTLDIDIVLAMTTDNLTRFIERARAIGLRPVIPVAIESLSDPELIEQWHREKGLLAFGLRGEDLNASVIDVLVRCPVPFDDLRQRAKLIPVGPLTIPVASIDDLITMKTGTGRTKDAIDIEELLKIKAGGAG